MAKFKIDFIGVGAQKAGTSALDIYLRKHPEIGMGNLKELNYFNNDSNFKGLFRDYSSYHDKFEIKQGLKVYGEITPVYMFKEQCIERIKRYNPNIKLIVILRNPVERAFSQWNMEYKRKFENLNFTEVINTELEQIKGSSYQFDRVKSYVSRGFYAVQIERILRTFSKEQVFFVKYEEFLENQKDTLLSIFDFLEVCKDSFDFSFEKVHSLGYSHTIDANDKGVLLEAYLEDTEKIEQMLHWDCSDWKT